MRAATNRSATPGRDIIVVNGADEEVGQDFKAAVHQGDGILHRAFSVYLFDQQSRLLLQQRSELKPLWPGYWSNSCCSHPRPGETTREAAARRLQEELGLVRIQSLSFLFKFQYHARYGESAAEHEVCSVFAAIADQPQRIDRREVAQTRYVTASLLDRQLRDRPQRYTPWLQMAWKQIRADHWPVINRMVGEAA
ncbi:isopentenyl-diphosphate delta-isomerase [Povalibacter uvarum]|uniref:Isopentenyl-diphosphate Delta-isomerase n=1 Tax=Povalibacter uvarum TaxID=732238 RepID=A0A841HN17_9GAMM|nr:isopentenyl-diphosphate Delta-isomerase [Povalibacter uvarum]MBB6093472.1 isopentenyl-diphosphate delta-isomerase [Povalibacter uvarum]